MLMDLLAVAGGLFVLLVGGDFMVRGAVALALRYGVSPLIVSLTIVAFGTSAPELLISVKSVLEGAPDIAFGNVVGSNIANVLLVLGVPALILPLTAPEGETRRTFIFMMVASVLLVILSFIRPLDSAEGLLLIVLLGLFLFDTFQFARKEQAAPDDVAVEDATMELWKVLSFLIGGLVALPLGANLLVDGAVNIAADLGVSQALIGVTIVAIGTSLPELATTVMAAVRKETDVAIGNVIGSNLFNILAILGVASLFGQLPAPEIFLRFDLWVMLASAALLGPLVLWGWTLTRMAGVALLLAYAAYIGVLVAWAV